MWCCGCLPCTPLRIAATAGHAVCVAYLIAQGAEVDLVDVKGQTALYVAVVNGHLDCVRILLEAGADPNGSRHHRSTPLYHAARVGRLDILQELIRWGSVWNLAAFTSAHWQWRVLCPLLLLKTTEEGGAVHAKPGQPLFIFYSFIILFFFYYSWITVEAFLIYRWLCDTMCFAASGSSYFLTFKKSLLSSLPECTKTFFSPTGQQQAAPMGWQSNTRSNILQEKHSEPAEKERLWSRPEALKVEGRESWQFEGRFSRGRWRTSTQHYRSYQRESS